jgi:hypothetical protein
MARQSEPHQLSLFDEETPRVKPCPARKIKLAGVVEALFREIAAALVDAKSGECIDEQDHC